MPLFSTFGQNAGPSLYRIGFDGDTPRYSKLTEVVEHKRPRSCNNCLAGVWSVAGEFAYSARRALLKIRL